MKRRTVIQGIVAAIFFPLMAIFPARKAVAKPVPQKLQVRRWFWQDRSHRDGIISAAFYVAYGPQQAMRELADHLGLHSIDWYAEKELTHTGDYELLILNTGYRSGNPWLGEDGHVAPLRELHDHFSALSCDVEVEPWRPYTPHLALPTFLDHTEYYSRQMHLRGAYALGKGKKDGVSE